MSQALAAAVAEQWHQLARQLSLADMAACTRACTSLRAALLQTDVNLWLAVAHRQLPALQATSVQQVLLQLSRATLALQKLRGPLSCNSWRHTTPAAVAAAVPSPNGCWVAVAAGRTVSVLCASSGDSHAVLDLGKGRQACTVSFSSDCSVLVVISQGKSFQYRLHGLDISSGDAAPTVELFREQHRCQVTNTSFCNDCLAVSYSFEDAQYGWHLEGLLFDMRLRRVQQKLSIPQHWRRLDGPSYLQACFSPDCTSVAAIPAAQPCAVTLFRSDALQQPQHRFLLQQACSVLSWIDNEQLLVRGQQPWLTLLDCTARSVLWTMETPKHLVLWPCPGSSHLLMESRRALADLTASRQLWSVCKASGSRVEVAADLDLHSTRLRACTLHPSGWALAVVLQTPGGKQQMCDCRLLQASQCAEQQSVQLADIEGARHPWVPTCSWSADGSRLLVAGRQAVDVYDLAG